MESTHVDTGHHGAKVQSTKKANPRALLIDVMRANPQWNEDKQEHREACFKRFLQVWFSDNDCEALTISIGEAWHANDFRNLLRTIHTSPTECLQAQERRKKEVQSRAEDLTAHVKKAVTERVKLMFLEMVMPNGKKLRDCTGRDCLKAGGLLTKVGKTLKPTQLVGDVYKTDATLRKLYA